MVEIVSTFVFVFVAALPGRTTFLLILLGASQPHRKVILGSIPAFVVQCAIAVLAGQLLKSVPHMYVQITAGLLFLYFGFKSWSESQKKEQAGIGKTPNSIKSIFVLFFFAELGDISQIAIATRASESSSASSVFAGAVVAMSLIVFIAVFAGKVLTKIIKPQTLEKVAALVFIVLGIYLLVTSMS